MTRFPRNISNRIVISDIQPSEWHSNIYIRERQLMLHRLIFLMEKRSCITLPKESLLKQLPGIAGRLEFILYSRSASFEEYSNLKTLRRRLRYLISSLFRQAEHENPHVVASLTSKRNTEVYNIHHKEWKGIRHNLIPLKKNEEKSMFLLNNQSDLIRHTYSFLTGVETCKHFLVNRSAYKILSCTIESLHFDLDLLRKGFQTNSRFFRQFAFLKEIFIVKSFRQQTADRIQELETIPCQQLEMHCRNDGEVLVQSLATMMEQGDLPYLKKLGIRSIFANTAHVDAARCICSALSKGSCPNLEYLGLGGNSIGDSGAISISQALDSGNLNSLKQLDIRMNFVGERGAISLFNSIRKGSCPQLEVLSAGGNIFDDRCAQLIADALTAGNCPNLRRLGLENNFIEMKGFVKIAANYCSKYCPLLRNITLNGNSIEDNIVQAFAGIKE